MAGIEQGSIMQVLQSRTGSSHEILQAREEYTCNILVLCFVDENIPPRILFPPPNITPERLIFCLGYTGTILGIFISMGVEGS